MVCVVVVRGGTEHDSVRQTERERDEAVVTLNNIKRGDSRSHRRQNKLTAADRGENASKTGKADTRKTRPPIHES